MVRGVVELEQGREAYANHKWVDARGWLVAADEATPLGPEDLELLARAGYMLGRDDDYVSGLERAHHAYLASGESLPAVSCAWWIGHNFLFGGRPGPPGDGSLERAGCSSARGVTASSGDMC